jgi:bifunctional DNA-binding transcriptional regulator/antitoxin component of YhaV-PrlF toxin-antitoxin module
MRGLFTIDRALMTTVTVSSKFQTVLPKEPREFLPVRYSAKREHV